MKCSFCEMRVLSRKETSIKGIMERAGTSYTESESTQAGYNTA